MEQTLHQTGGETCLPDHQVWERVEPGLEPYPAPREGMPSPIQKQNSLGGYSELDSGRMGGSQGNAYPAAPMAPVPKGGVPAPRRMESGMVPYAAPGTGVPARPDPIGGIQDPCCMGSAAAEMLEVIQGFLEEELLDRRHDLMLARQAPSFARSTLRGIAAAAEGRARQLMAAYYLITGRCIQQPTLGPASQVYLGRWCPAIRERYHAEVCSAMNYIRAAEGTTDPCLARMFQELGASADQDARQLMALLERAL